MEIRADIVLQAVVKSFSEVILPALDPNNSLAQEQSRLMLGLLTLLRERLPRQYEYDKDELSRLLALAGELDIAAHPARAAQVDACLAVRERAGATPTELVEAITVMRSMVSDAVERVFAGPGQETSPALKSVMAAAREQHLRQRAWLLMQGWESDPAAVPAIEELIPFIDVAGAKR